ncbi:helix-turn-helix domain-containing protein [Herbiconiux sp. CPCC 205716]|uniref:Helix-turn-helix domain-containing protein n=1 Tax=Herbiconiux gentiana TaxID=2970912 RepID=A0ABT2GFC0_9MICO|nr:helix-turn-helix domain-containing protein [Herbiconiux gentiana]MCS5714913.1 helix-turn-helix domain-containing protein [Herbiconiux gentiana]
MTTATPPDTGRKAITYLPNETTHDEIVDFARTLREIEQHLLHRSSDYAELVAPDGGRRAIPAEVFRALEQVVDALATGKGVTVAPYSTLLTTQEAANFLGISRPTLVKLLDGGEMEFEKRNRHRKVTLRALVDYQERSRQERRSALSDYAKAGQEIDSYYRRDDDAAMRAEAL